MALVEIFHVVANEYTLDTSSGYQPISEGMLVAFAPSQAGVRRVDATTTALGVLGIAGDTVGSTASAMPGIYPGWQNRVSDSFDETKASAKITVYSGGGMFATDMYVAGNVDASKLGHYLKANTTYGTLEYEAQTRTVNSVAQLIGAAGNYPSGVPGTATGLNGDMALKGANSDQYIVIKLLV